MIRGAAALAVVLGLVAPAAADVVRYAVLIGANEGGRGEGKLSFA